MTAMDLLAALGPVVSRDPHRDVVLVVEEQYVDPACSKCQETRLTVTRKVVTGLAWRGRDIVLETEDR